MTRLRRLSPEQMKAETGIAALGYARPQDNEVLIVDGLPKPLEHHVLEHEHEHISKGEEGAFLPALIAGGAALAGGVLGANAAGDAADVSAAGQAAALAENRRQFDTSSIMNLAMNMPSINAGNAARSQLMRILGIGGSGSSNIDGSDFKTENWIDGRTYADARDQGKPWALGVQTRLNNGQAVWKDGAVRDRFETPFSRAVDKYGSGGGGGGMGNLDPMKTISRMPGYEFMKKEGTDAVMQKGRALGLGKSGMTATNVGDYVGQGVAMPFYNDYMNRLGSLAGGGTNSAQSTSSAIGNLATSSGAINSGLISGAADSRASGILGQAGAYQGAANNIATIAGDYFGSKKPSPVSTNTNYSPVSTNFNGWLRN